MCRVSPVECGRQQRLTEVQTIGSHSKALRVCACLCVCDRQRCLLSCGKGKYELLRGRLMAKGRKRGGMGLLEGNQIYLTLAATSRTTN